MEIVNQKTERCAHKDCRHRTELFVPRGERANGKKRADDKGHARGKTVHAVGDVAAVGHARKDDDRDGVKAPTEFQRFVGKWQVHRRGKIAGVGHDHDIRGRERELKKELLLPRQSLVLLPDQFAVIVNKPDRSVSDRKPERQRQRNIFRPAPLYSAHDEKDCHNDQSGKDKAQSAHDGSPLF